MHRSLLICALVSLVINVAAEGMQMITVEDKRARCLDGSPYVFYIYPGNTSEWSIGIRGGGWCLTEESCKIRTQSSLGSSIGYNMSGTWGPTSANINGAPVESTCQGLSDGCTRVYMPYCDGSAFTSQNFSEKVSAMGLHYKGFANMKSTIDILESRFGYSNAARVVVYGGSAGGLSTFLHVDYFADRLMMAQRNRHHRKLNPSVVGRPVAGFFISEANYDPSIPSYADQIKNGVRMFNSSNALNQNCLAAYPGEEWKCFMAQYMAPYVRQQLFIVQSRFDEFQLMELLGLPCFARQAYVPPFRPSNCTSNEKSMIKSFGERLYTLLMGAIS